MLREKKIPLSTPFEIKSNLFEQEIYISFLIYRAYKIKFNIPIYLTNKNQFMNFIFFTPNKFK